MTSAKPECLILDFVGYAGKHALCTVTDVLGGSYDDDEVEAAKKKVREDGMAPGQALKAAREELRQLAAIAAAKVKARHQDFDPFRVLHISRDNPKLARYGASPATDAQIAALERAGIDARHMSKGEAMAMMDAIMARRQRGLATPNQLKVLAKHGIEKINISFGNANKVIDYIASQQWRPDPKRLAAMMASL